ncbi:MAG TPA: hypothetical protein VK563_12665 [Puia sp.]|nr:hypothetical protein [Puia sp.]
MFLLAGVFSVHSVHGQNYHAVEGSPFAGSLGVANNPASIVSSPYPWDITVFSFQLKNSTNAVTISNYSLLSGVDSSRYAFNNGNSARFFNFNFNIHLLNATVAINRRHWIAFGANVRGYGIGSTGRFNYNDSLNSIHDFFTINKGDFPFQANVASSAWIELFATYAQTIRDDEYGRLNAGVTLKAMRGISGGFVQLKDASVTETGTGAQTIYTLHGGTGKYGYSSNYDLWQKDRSTSQNVKDLLVNSRGGLAIDLGAEYLVKTQAVTNYSSPAPYNEYEWKFGVSLLDIGQNTFRYGTQSRFASDPKPTAADAVLDAKFRKGIQSLAGFNDTVNTLVNNFQTLTGFFNIRNPARLVINVDKPLQDNFSVNANYSLNLTGSNKGKNLSVQEMNVLILTPRWETRRWGFYLPIQYTTERKLWIGGAFKVGPLLLGIHNWANVFSKSSTQNGGGYIALVIRSGGGFADKVDKQYDCPKESRY